jgi:hypothetical protein
MARRIARSMPVGSALGAAWWRARLLVTASSAAAYRLSSALVLLSLSACSATATRPESSTLGCAQAVLDQHVPSGIKDKLAHCVAAALIARYCSPAEATLVSMGKEVRDMFGAGDAEWADWRADRAGIRCAAESVSDAAVSTCCASAAQVADGLRN